LVTCAPGFCAPVASAGAAQKLKGPACPSSTTGLVMKKRAVCLATSRVVEAQASTRISASYRATDPGLPEPADLFRGCLGLRADSIRWTRSASEGDTPRMRAVSRRVGNSVLIVTRCLILFHHFPFKPVGHLMWVEADRTANAEKWDSVVFYLFVYGSYGDTEQISQFFDREGLVLRTQPFGEGH
jgi:hypothetical protein